MKWNADLIVVFLNLLADAYCTVNLFEDFPVNPASVIHQLLKSNSRLLLCHNHRPFGKALHLRQKYMLTKIQSFYPASYQSTYLRCWITVKPVVLYNYDRAYTFLYAAAAFWEIHIVDFALPYLVRSFLIHNIWVSLSWIWCDRVQALLKYPVLKQYP